MEHEYDGAADHAGDGPEQENRGSLQTVTETGTVKYSIAGPECSSCEFEDKEGTNSSYSITASAWNGIIPDPASFNAYSPEVREKIIAWTDEGVYGASRCADRALEAASRQATRSQWLTFLSTVASILLSVIALMVTGSLASLAPLSVPLVTIAVNVARSKNDY